MDRRAKVVDLERRLWEDALKAAEQAGIPPEDVKLGTIDLVRKAQAENPLDTFVLVLGEDAMLDLEEGRWKEGETLRTLVPIVVVPREGYHSSKSRQRSRQKSTLANLPTNQPTITPVSSTSVRTSTDVAYLARALEPAVFERLKKDRRYAFGL